MLRPCQTVARALELGVRDQRVASRPRGRRRDEMRCLDAHRTSQLSQHAQHTHARQCTQGPGLLSVPTAVPIYRLGGLGGCARGRARHLALSALCPLDSPLYVGRCSVPHVPDRHLVRLFATGLAHESSAEFAGPTSRVPTLRAAPLVTVNRRTRVRVLLRAYRLRCSPRSRVLQL